MMKDVVAGGLNIRKNDAIFIGIAALCNDPTEWQQPDQFIPERFNSDSPFYLTPGGKKRNPFSFSPFLGGMRICLGKTFIEEVSKVTLPNIYRKFDFQLENPDSFVMPFNNMLCQWEPKVMIKLLKR
jgi:cytochrome P450